MLEAPSILIKRAELIDKMGSARVKDVRFCGDTITAVGELSPAANERCVDADGGLLIPGLNDHHVHLASYAASLQSVRCGPPDIHCESELIEAINRPGSGWLRGTGFQEDVCPDLDRAWLDQNGPARPVRIQHRSGRLWIFNTLAIEAVRAAAADLAPHEQVRVSRTDGLYYDADEILGGLIQSEAPPIRQASQRLAELGVTGLNDMTPTNDIKAWDWFVSLQHSGDLLQRVRMSGRSEMSTQEKLPGLVCGEVKVHLHDTVLPEFEGFVDLICNSHSLGRGVAVHCVTEVELVFTLAAFRAAGAIKGDRIEHASVMPFELVEQLVELGLGVVTQPNFVRERGDVYLRDIPSGQHDSLYRVRSLGDQGVPMAFGTDLPFGDPDPWAAMRAATERRTLGGQCLGEQETVSPEQALLGFLGSLENPFVERTVTVGAEADLCLLKAPWQTVRLDLAAHHLRLTVSRGKIISGPDS